MLKERLKTGWQNWWSWNGEDCMIWLQAFSIVAVVMICVFGLLINYILTIPLILLCACIWLFRSIWKHGEPK